ncbi:hypothetical protein [Clostridium neonatale]|uniref:Uncharacterized protein n=1 Tax=Clostridium neonatale TaxID=137838 RepID=A0AAD1YEI2_9CLOT|nr:hypothetical protein [Clostridium neonatale]CAI3198827.1 conserved hypothetical protein [Clostridium neonatale]CAI3202359.1 conserved hypothetical protein [Clostridium neonatale]CAI3216574.1 conserved hypothetical protein [Clostridium neonatale]CAI3224706.1 conserved hypothetical protein [Clostridium neonatale]CAI3229324.1 conserved hypothetical protein [Clostridium neonatale]
MSIMELNKRDLRHINKNLKYLMEQTTQQYKELNIPLSEKDYILLENAMLKALKNIKIKNKQKYTPKKYRH